MKHKLKSRLLAEISITSNMWMIPSTLKAESEEDLKEPLDESERGEEKVGLMLNILRSWHLVPSLHGK